MAESTPAIGSFKDTAVIVGACDGNVYWGLHMIGRPDFRLDWRPRPDTLSPSTGWKMKEK